MFFKPPQENRRVQKQLYRSKWKHLNPGELENKYYFFQATTLREESRFSIFAHVQDKWLILSTEEI